MEEKEQLFQHLKAEFAETDILFSINDKYPAIFTAHAAIHEFAVIAPYCYPENEGKDITWHRKSAFLIYHWEIVNLAHRSLNETLLNYYNVGFILLRNTMEMIIKGAFWECMSHKTYRNSSTIVSEIESITQGISERLALYPEKQEELERTTAVIFDVAHDYITEYSLRPSMKTMIKQLVDWGILDPIAQANNYIYNNLYVKYSADVHEEPNRTDIGRRVVDNTTPIFGQNYDSKALVEYSEAMKSIMDVCMIVELNIFNDHIVKFPKVKEKLQSLLMILDYIGTNWSAQRIRELL